MAGRRRSRRPAHGAWLSCGAVQPGAPDVGDAVRRTLAGAAAADWCRAAGRDAQSRDNRKPSSCRHRSVRGKRRKSLSPATDSAGTGGCRPAPAVWSRLVFFGGLVSSGSSKGGMRNGGKGNTLPTLPYLYTWQEKAAGSSVEYVRPRTVALAVRCHTGLLHWLSHAGKRHRSTLERIADELQDYQSLQRRSRQNLCCA